MTSLYPAIYAVLISFALSVILCYVLIPFLRRLKLGQNVRDDGPQSHLKKAGTPSMGGIMIVISFAVACCFFHKDVRTLGVILFVALAFALLGFWDDYIKVVKKRSLGLRAYQKMLGQIIIAGVTVALLYLNNDAFFGGTITQIVVPFTDKVWDMGWLYAPFTFIVIIGTVNSSNLTDGLDSGVTVLMTTFFLFIALAANQSLTPYAGALIGSLLGFLLFNSHPARVMMGDTGSLALGGIIAIIAVLLRMPLFILIVGFAYVAECLSVILQVGFFKLTKKRIFKMAPIHHSFELSGWSETRVVALFYIVTAMLCLIGYLGYKA